jgi:hypothetical protein
VRDRPPAEGAHHLQLGHIFSLEEAHILLQLRGDGAPWRLAHQEENLVPECSHCNYDHRSRSFSPERALACWIRVNGETLPGLRADVCLEILRWCQIAAEVRP